MPIWQSQYEEQEKTRQLKQQCTVQPQCSRPQPEIAELKLECLEFHALDSRYTRTNTPKVPRTYGASLLPWRKDRVFTIAERRLTFNVLTRLTVYQSGVIDRLFDLSAYIQVHMTHITNSPWLQVLTSIILLISHGVTIMGTDIRTAKPETA
jgi:hypothetical protein